VDRSSAWPYLFLGSLYLELNDPASAESAYREALAREPGNVYGYAWLGNLLAREGAADERVEEARAQFQKAADLFPGSAVAWDRVGYGYRLLNQMDEAIENYQRALRLDPARTATYDAILSIYAGWGRLDSYLPLFQGWRKSYSNEPWPTGLLARAYEKLDRVDDAIHEYEAILARVPEYADAHYSLAVLYERASRRDEALKQWNIYLTLASSNPQQFEAEERLQRLTQIVIAAPQAEATVKGRVEVRGTANLAEGFVYYKLEYRPPGGEWQLIGDLHHQPVVDGLLGVWDVSGLAPGRYQLRLVVVDNTGNFLPPFEMWVNVEKP